MKLSSLATLVAASVLLAACNSLDNPFTNLFHGNHDGRVYDPQTGQWNYPAGSATPSPQKSAAVASTLASTPAPQSTGGGGRYFDPQKNQWVEMHNADSPSPSDPHSAASPAASATASAPAVVAPPRPGPGFRHLQPLDGEDRVAVGRRPRAILWGRRETHVRPGERETLVVAVWLCSARQACRGAHARPGERETLVVAVWLCSVRQACRGAHARSGERETLVVAVLEVAAASSR